MFLSYCLFYYILDLICYVAFQVRKYLVPDFLIDGKINILPMPLLDFVPDYGIYFLAYVLHISPCYIVYL